MDRMTEAEERLRVYQPRQRRTKQKTALSHGQIHARKYAVTQNQQHVESYGATHQHARDADKYPLL